MSMYVNLVYSLAEDGPRKKNPKLWERRRELRYPVARQVVCETENRSFSATVLDVGPGGLRLSASTPLSPGDDVRIHWADDSQSGAETISCSIQWTTSLGDEGLQAGLRYDFSDGVRGGWIREALAEVGHLDRSANRRRSRRIDTNLAVSVQTLAAEPLAEGTAVNLSFDGLLVHLPSPLAAGTCVRLQVGPQGKLPPLKVLGKVLASNPDSGGYLHNLRIFGRESTALELSEQYVSALQG